MNSISRERVEWIDCAKGIGILLVILGHAVVNGILSQFTHSFHMPLFFVISGYLFSERRRTTELAYIGRKARSLLIPYAFFGLATYAVWVAVCLFGLTEYETTDYLSPLFHLLWINTTGLKISGEFWFLTALFFASVLYRILWDRIPNSAARTVCTAVLALIGCLFRRLLSIQLPWAILSGLVGMGFMELGFRLKQYRNSRIGSRLLSLRWYEALVLLAVSTVLIFLNSEVNMRRSVYGILPLFWFSAAAMTLLLFNISRWLEKADPRSAGGRFVGILKNIGKDSILYVCLDSMVLKVLSAVVRRILPSGLPSAVQLILCLAEAAVAVVILYLMNILIQKTKLKFLLGK